MNRLGESLFGVVLSASWALVLGFAFYFIFDWLLPQ